MKTAIIVNYSSCDGLAQKRWSNIEKIVLQKLPDRIILIPYKAPFNLKDTLSSLIYDSGVRFFIGAGGDGTMNYLINDLFSITGGNMEGLFLGAIGLGSSNDFHKPVKNSIKGIPVKLDIRNPMLSDVGKVVFNNPRGEMEERIFLINSSLGFTAEGNYLFNHGDKIIRKLKPQYVTLTILYAILKTLVTFKNLPLEIHGDCESGIIKTTNLSITIKPFISGNFRYEELEKHDRGKMGLYITEDHSRLEILRLLYDLTKGRFCEGKKRHSSEIKELKVMQKNFIALETDGEVFYGNSFSFSIIPDSIFIAT